MTKARFYPSPIEEAAAELEIVEPTRLTELFPDLEAMNWFRKGGSLALNGEVIPPHRWPVITVKPNADLIIDFVAVPGSKKTFALLATVALVALTTAISGGLLGPTSGTIGLGILGSSFAAGGVGANILAAGVGLAGSLAITALSAPPKTGAAGADQRNISQAGVTGNPVTALDTLPVILGEIGYSPPHVAPPYTTWDGDTMTAHAVVGVQGRCLVEGLKVNGLPAAEVPGLTYEIREGKKGDVPRTTFLQTVIEERDGVTLSNFFTDLVSTKNDTLKDQVTPANSSPKWHPFQTAGNFTKVVIRLMFPSGIVDVANNRSGFVAVRIQLRKKGETTWRKIPTIHIQDVNKGAGPMRCEIALRRENPPGGRHYAWAEQEFPVTSINNLTGTGKTFEYQADAYFNPGVQYPFWGVFDPSTGMTSNTAPSPFVASASSETNGAAWRAFDNSGVSTYWSPANGSVPGAWLKLDLGSAKTIRCYEMRSNYAVFDAKPDHMPTKWVVEGSNDNSSWTLLSTIDDTGSTFPTGWFNIESPGSYRYYRWTFNEVVTGTALRVAHLVPHEGKCPGSMFGHYSGGEQGQWANQTISGVSLYAKCVDCLITETGADIYLRPEDWPEGEYEVRMMRSQAAAWVNLEDELDYELNNNKDNADYFDYRLNGGLYKIFTGQKNFRSDCTIEAFQTIADESPFDDDELTMISISLPNAQISSIYAVFTRYASTYDGTIWSAEKVPTKNPAALYRDILLGEANAKPVPGECIDEDSLAAWYETCEANGYECNAVLQNARVADAKQILATCGYAAPRDADTYGVIEDKDTTSEPVRYLIAAHNSRDEGTTQEMPDIPDAIRAEFSDKTKSYAVEHAIIYRAGKNALNAKRFETFNYQGFTDLAKVEARAAFDLKQAQLRQVRYHRRVGMDGIMLERGMVVGLGCDIIDGNRAGGLITAITTDVGGNVLSITLDNAMPWGTATDIDAIDDIDDLTDVMNPTQAMGVAIRIPRQPALIKAVSEVTDSNVCTFVTPFPLAGSGLAVGQLVVGGVLDNVVRRCKIMAIIPKGINERLLVLADEAPDLYA